MNLSERTEMLDRFFENGRVVLRLSGDGVEPSRANQKKLNRALLNMEIIENKILKFDSEFYRHKKSNREKDLNRASLGLEYSNPNN
jgi:hypothetical protein